MEEMGWSEDAGVSGAYILSCYGDGIAPQASPDSDIPSGIATGKGSALGLASC